MGATVQECFSQAVSTYDAHAHVQRFAAKQLADLLAQYLGELKGTILELGCGTGIFTEQYLSLCAQAKQICLSDISEEMLTRSKERLKGLDYPICHKKIDALVLRSSVAFDLILASYVHQWLGGIRESLSCHLSCLAPGGHLCIAFPTAGSFPQWHRACEAAEIACTAHSLPSFKEAVGLVENRAKILYAKELDFVDRYPSPLHFLRALQKMGAQARPGVEYRESKYSIRRLLRRWHAEDQDLEITWKTGFLLLQKV